MKDTDTPNRPSNMEKAEGDREAITNVEDERTSDASTITNGGLAGGRPEGGAKKKPGRPGAKDDPALRTEM